MSTAAPSKDSLAPSTSPASLAVRAWATAVAAALALNLLVLALGAGAGADLLVTPPGAPGAMSVGAVSVILMTVAPTVLGLAVLVLAGRWGPRGWTATAWLGLGLGIVTVAMPLSAQAGGGTKLTLASMHVLTGLAWYLAVRRSPASRAASS